MVGEDIDLLVLVTTLSPSSCTNIYFLKPGKLKLDHLCYSANNLKYSKHVKDNILFLHAFSGCDTTSAFFRKGKIQFVKLLDKKNELQDIVSIFLDDNANANDIDDAGQLFITTLYADKCAEMSSLDKLRYQLFAKSLMKKSFNLASLPPTQAAARQHSLRTYHQIQMWIGNEKNPLDWGWKNTKYGLVPITTNKDAAPQSVLKKVSCKCAKGCRGSCSCRKLGMTCSNICFNCRGQSCTNCLKDDQEEFPQFPSPGTFSPGL